jgi:hypothetical protein
MNPTQIGRAFRHEVFEVSDARFRAQSGSIAARQKDTGVTAHRLCSIGEHITFTYEEQTKTMVLTEIQQNTIALAVWPLVGAQRRAFLQAVSEQLQAQSSEVGDGTVSRVCRDLQRRFFTPPI